MSEAAPISTNTAPRRPSLHRSGWSGSSGGKRPLGPEFEYLTHVPSAEGPRRLQFPLKVELATGEEVAVVAYAPAIDVGGVGESTEEAIQDMLQTGLLLHSELASTPEADLDSTAVGVLKLLQSVFG